MHCLNDVFIMKIASI